MSSPTRALTPRNANSKPVPTAIKITPQGKGTFTYDPSTVQVKAGQSIFWTTEKLGPFAVSFSEATPFKNEITITSFVNDNGDNVTKIKKIAKGKVGHHHYCVAVAINDPTARHPTIKVALDTGCPDIVVSS